MPTSTNPITVTLGQVANETGTLAHAGQTALAIYFSNLTILQALSVLISAALLTGTVIMIIKTSWLANRVDRVRHVVLKSDVPKKKVQESWKKAQAHFFAGDDNDLKIAIMQADNILEDALRRAGVRGANLGDRLKNLKKTDLANLDEIWQAHKLRNQIAHEANFTLKRDLAERTLGIYERALESLGVLNQEK
jgi:hypothetical protein